jgi:hypothetical protein
MGIATQGSVMANNALERTMDYRGPHPGCQQVVLLFTGLYMFVLPYATRARSGASKR